MAKKRQPGFVSGIYLALSLWIAGGLTFNAFAQKNDVKEGAIPVRFSLKEGGYVSLVIEDTSGFRVRNLVSETWFSAGEHTIWWDATTDLNPDAYAAQHGVYHINTSFASAGKYRVRGICRKAITTHYEFSVYNPGTPPWELPDHTGSWLANHSPPQAALFLPAQKSPAHQGTMLLGCYVTEGPDGLIWTNTEGKKLGGKNWLIDTWTVAPFLTLNAGATALPGIAAYTGSVWPAQGSTGMNELRINALTAEHNDFKAKKAVRYLFSGSPQSDPKLQMGGIAAFNDQIVVSLTTLNKLLVFNLIDQKLIDSIAVNDPRGLAFDTTGHLLVLSGRQLVRYAMRDGILNKPQVIVKSNLDDPYGITIDRRGSVYISDRGNSNNIKIFSAGGKLIKQVGKAGAPAAGSYNPLQMQNPAGLAIDDKNQLWVTEQDYLPKRVSVWTLDGKLIKAFYGPGKYGGGGTIDPVDKTRFYYADNNGAMEFALDWVNGRSALKTVYYRRKAGDTPMPFRAAAPETPLYHNGQRFFANCFNSNPTGGSNTAVLFSERNQIAVPVAAMGKASDWEVLKQPEFKPQLPPGVNLSGRQAVSDAFFIWQDKNADGMPQPGEVSFKKGQAAGVTIMPDLSFCVAWLDSMAVIYRPVKFSENGSPLYDMEKAEIIASQVLKPASSGGQQVLVDTGETGIITLGIKPYDKLAVSGVKHGKLMWTYPDLWPGLHASHNAPVPANAGELIGTTRLLGQMLHFTNTDVPAMWAVNGNHGNVYLFTSDGIFVTTLFKDKTLGRPWNMPVAKRGMLLDSLTLGEENFWPTIVQTDRDQKTYLVDGARSAIIRLDGLNSVKRLPDTFVMVTAAAISKSRQQLLQQEQTNNTVKAVDVVMLKDKPVVDGRLDEWALVPGVKIDNPKFEPGKPNLRMMEDIECSMGVYHDTLYLAYCTGDPNLLQNTGENPALLFKTGGALDLMLGPASPAGQPRAHPVAGDCRIVVALVKGKPLAMLYRPVVPGTKAGQSVAFSSPAGNVVLDRVDDISGQIKFGAGNGNYELAIPLATVGLKFIDGLHFKGDAGVLKSADGKTISRLYWSNKAAATTADVPSEAMLMPALWGTLIFKK